MKRLLLAIFAVLMLSGMSCTRFIRADPIPAHCNPVGFEVCKSQARWEGDPEDPRTFDNLGKETLNESRTETRNCEIRRKALDQCLRRLEAEKVIVL